MRRTLKPSTYGTSPASCVRICRILLSLTVLLGSMSLARSVWADDITYDYTGNALESYPDIGEGFSAPAGQISGITGSVTFDIPPDFTGTSTNATSIELSVAGNTYDTLDGNTGYIGSADANFVNGQITQWNVEIASDQGPTLAVGTANSSEIVTYPNNGGVGPAVFDAAVYVSPSCGFECLNLGDPGTWTLVSDNGAPPPPPPAPSCTSSSILNGAVNVSISSSIMLLATFTPQGGVSGLSAAEADCGFSSFNWTSEVTHDPTPLTSALTGQPLSVPYPDPPQGGYLINGKVVDNTQYPYYYSAADLAGGDCTTPAGDSIGIETTTSLTFCDAPQSPQLPAGGYVGFTTDLVGICSQIGESGCTSIGQAVDLYQIIWTDNYDGSSGSIAFNGSALRSNLDADDPTGGTGGVDILSEGLVPLAEPIPEPSTFFVFITFLIILIAVPRKRLSTP